MHTDTDTLDLSTAAGPGRVPHPARRRSLTRATFSACLRHRITGLAAEAAFWALLSLPPLALGVVGVLGYLQRVGPGSDSNLERTLTASAGTVLSARQVRQTVVPALHSMLTSGHADVVSLGFLFALWSGSRALNVAIDTITVASGQSGRRGIVRTRLLSFALYLPALLLGAVLVPLLLAGPGLLAEVLPRAYPLLGPALWLIAAGVLVVFVTTLYHLALPVRPRWRTGLPGALVALALWAVGSALLRVYLHTSQSGATGAVGFGRVAATAAILLWLYVTALAVLVGAVFNAVRAAAADPAARAAPVARGAKITARQLRYRRLG
jgi:membrane protein